MIIPTTRSFSLANNSAQKLTDDTAAWLHTEPIPPFATKDLYREWCKHPDTDYNFFNFTEGIVPSLRATAGNEIYKIHGIIADYDCPGLTEAEVAKGIGRISPPYAWNRTFSGGVRAVWLFETPVFYYEKDVWKKFVTRCIKELKIASGFAKLDDAIFTPEIYFCTGNNWTINPSTVIPAERLALWMLDACKVFHDKSSQEIPLELVAAEVERLFPGRHKGDFADGSRTCRFWDPTGDALAAIIKPSGVICFTGGESFMPWEKILGRAFTQKYQEDRLGKAIADMYGSSDAYFRQLSTGAWDGMGVEMTKRHLKVQYGLSDQTRKGDDASEIERLLNHLETKKRVEGVLPFPLNPNTIVKWNGFTYLNSSTARLLPPHPEPQQWGENFPWLAEYLTVLFLDEKNLKAFLSWLAVWVKSANEGRSCRGQAMFIVGAPDTGKSLLSRQIIARIVGGYADARDHLVDGNQFNSSLFEKASWVIDDSTALSSPKTHARFSSLVKAVVANDSHPYNKKYGYSGNIPFVGRLIVTLNEDPVSLGILPDTDQSLIDKAFMLRTGSTKAKVAPTEKERYEIIDRELPYFVRYLVDFTYPDWIEQDSRFGIKAWHDRMVLEEARAGAPSRILVEVIDEWRRKVKRKGNVWVGTTTALYQLLILNFPAVLRSTTPTAMGKLINQAMSNGNVDWIKRARVGDNRSAGLSVILIPEPGAQEIE